MSQRDEYPAGVPCWVECLEPDVPRALEFYRQLFDWNFVGSGPMPKGSLGEYFVARKADREVAGIAPSPPGVSAGWATQIAVTNVEASLEKAELAGGKSLIDPFDASPAGRLGVVSDPTNAIVCLWQAESRQGAQTVNEPSAWAMSMLHTPDLATSKAFYADVFGWTYDDFDSMTLARLPGYVGGEPQQPVPRDVVAVLAANDDVTSYWNVDFWVRDVDWATKTVERLGGRVVVPSRDAAGMRTAVVADPQHATFSMTQLKLG